MRLLIVSNMTHCLNREGEVVGWGPTVEEIDALATLFHEIRHLAFLHPGDPPPTLLPYRASNVRFVPLPPSGGPTWKHKVGILRRAPVYLAKMLREFRQADAVFVRCPANISLMAIILLAFVRRPRYRWVKYAGNWKPNGREPWSYTFQRWWLNKGLHRGVVTVNGRWPDQPCHVYSFLNPSLTEQDIEEGRRATDGKELRLPPQILFVGRVEEAKGAGRVLQIAAGLREGDIPFELHMLGDGPERAHYERTAKELGLDHQVHFHGWVPKTQLPNFYARGHFILLPSSASEGWPKVLSEAMAYGAVPLAGAISSIPQVLAETGAGVALPPDDTEAFVKAISSFVDDPTAWRHASQQGMEAARLFTYDAYLDAIREMFWDAWGMEPSILRREVR